MELIDNLSKLGLIKNERVKKAMAGVREHPEPPRLAHHQQGTKPGEYTYTSPPPPREISRHTCTPSKQPRF